MDRLSRPHADLKEHYEVVVVGSGYGGGVAAARLARAGRSVCLLERGREIQPGEYPNTLSEAAGELQMDLNGVHTGSSLGMFDIRVNDDINVVQGCGLGGTSLINANVSLQPEPRVFDDPRWPQAIREAAGAGDLEPYFERAGHMLRPLPYPDDQPLLPKLAAHERSGQWLAQRVDAPEIAFTRPPINVTFETGVNHVGVHQQACNGCGDCCSGCNNWAKNTTLMNYIPDAHNHGAEIYTGVSVRRLARAGGRWTVFFQRPDIGRELFEAPEMFISADLVVLAAGTLGSTEILLRSKAHGLALSDRVGERFTGNGDVLAFGYNCDQEINGIGFGDADPAGREPVGPCITGLIDMRGRPELDQGMVVEEGSLPGALAKALPAGFAAGAKAFGRDTDDELLDDTKETLREVASLVGGAYRGAMRNTQTFLVMTHDDAGGRMYLEDDRLRIEWPEVGEQPIFERVGERLRAATEALGGTYLVNPIWSETLGRRLVTVHPLGGCVMADSAEQGVVNAQCQVFSGGSGGAVYDSLYVCDGAVMPRSLGTNPLYTITALAERSMAELARARGWSIEDAERRELAPGRRPKLGLRFTERMAGYMGRAEAFEDAAREGEAAGDRLEFTLTIESDDLERMLADQDYAAGLTGTVTAPKISAQPLTATGGRFRLFVRDPSAPQTRTMRYTMDLASAEGRRLAFEGYKVMRDDPGLDTWADTTTLYVTLTDRDGGAVVGRGVLRIKPVDFAKQLTTLEVLDAEGMTQALSAKVRFGRYFAGNLIETYLS